MKIDRLIGILSVLLQRDKVTSQELAEKFEVSRRTILRDIESINIAGIPIVSEQGQGGGISIMDGYKIDRTLLSSGDMQAILSGLRSLDSVSGTNHYRQLMEKLSADDMTSVNVDNHIIIDLSSWDKSAIADIEAYDGIHGLFVHAGGEQGYFVKVAYHEGLVPADTWLRVQDKKSHNQKFNNNGVALNSWLVGMMKCGNCGYAMHINHSTNKQGRTYRYFYDYGRKTMTGCSHDYATELKPDQVEDIVYMEMCKRIEQLVIAKHESTKPDPDSEAVRTEIIKVDEEIGKLMGRLADADDVLFSYIQDRVSKLHEQKSALERKLQTKTRKRKAIDTKPLEEPLKIWDSLTVQEKHNIAVMMIDVVYVSDENGVEVVFSI